IASKFEQAASDLGMSIEDLLLISIKEKFRRDSQFETVERNAEIWDREIERDAASGKLDDLCANC
ncbi:MAG TPA: hypothetical protein VGI70_11630, partial [Polyangiales bacterium]